MVLLNRAGLKVAPEGGSPFNILQRAWKYSKPPISWYLEDFLLVFIAMHNNVTHHLLEAFMNTLVWLWGLMVKILCADTLAESICASCILTLLGSWWQGFQQE